MPKHANLRKNHNPVKEFTCHQKDIACIQTRLVTSRYPNLKNGHKNASNSLFDADWFGFAVKWLRPLCWKDASLTYPG